MTQATLASTLTMSFLVELHAVFYANVRFIVGFRPLILTSGGLEPEVSHMSGQPCRSDRVPVTNADVKSH